MKLHIEIDVDGSETIVDSIKRGSFVVDNDGSGHKIRVGDTIVVPSRKCKVRFNEVSTKEKKNGDT